jgi:protein O-mannosyl-transferase
MKIALSPNKLAWLAFALFSLATAVIYAQGLNGAFVFDDFPNIVDNQGIKPDDASMANLVRSALSSPSSEFKRPLASLSFAFNYLATGLDARPMKATNVVIHLMNGLLVFLFTRLLVTRLPVPRGDSPRPAVVAAFIAGAWLLLPINLTAVLYVVQRMESLANLFVMAGLVWYTSMRVRMQATHGAGTVISAVLAIVICTALGAMAKETAIMLPLYALIVDVVMFRLRSARTSTEGLALDRRVVALYVLVLLIPLVIGLAWLVPGLLSERAWSTRDFTLGTRLLTELRVVAAYIGWTLAPTPGSLSFYHDDWIVSRGFLQPWTTLASAAFLAALMALAVATRRRFPLVTLGLMLFFGSHLLTATILPLELVYEHRNYFASLGLLIAIVPWLWPSPAAVGQPARLPIVRATLLALFMIECVGLLYITVRAWDSPLSLARELADRSPGSPRAQYELGRTYIILSQYDPASPFTRLAEPPLVRAMKLPGSSVLAEQALIYFRARMNQPVDDAWWASMMQKLRTNKVTVQDESALGSLTQCAISNLCTLSTEKLANSFLAALEHPDRSARLYAMYSDFEWNLEKDRDTALVAIRYAIKKNPSEPAYRFSLIRMLLAQGEVYKSREERDALVKMNIGGALDSDLGTLNALISSKTTTDGPAVAASVNP